MKKIKVIFLSFMFLAIVAAISYAKVFPYPGDFTFGVLAAQNSWDSFADLVIPVAWSETSFLFVSPRLSGSGEKILKNSENEFNVGLGYRQYLNILKNGAIIGVNAYYDRRTSAFGNTFLQAGAGIEFLSEWFDVRFNGYIPFDDKYYYIGKVYDVPLGHHVAATYEYESSMSGADAKLDIKLPIPESFGKLKIFGGYYYFSSERNQDILKGAKAGAEYKVFNILRLTYAVYQNKDFNGSSWQAGADIRIPIDFRRLLQAKNPISFTANKTVQNRMGEMVQRDMHVRTSDVKEKHPEDLLLNFKGDVYYFTVVSPNGAGDGTFERPASLADGVVLNNGVVGSNAALLFLPGQYDQNVSADISQHQAARIEVLSYKSLAAGNNVCLPGLDINESSVLNLSSDINAVVISSGSANNYVDIMVSGLDIKAPAASAKSGIYLADISSGSLLIESNNISGFDKGIEVRASTAGAFITNNIVENNVSGIDITAADPIIYANLIQNNAGAGIVVNNNNEESQIIYNNIINNSTGIYINSSANTVAAKNFISSSSNSGIYINSSSNLQISDNDIYYSWGNGIYILNSSTISVNSNLIYQSGAAGIFTDNLKFSDISKNTALENAADGISMNASNSVSVSNNDISGNQNGITDIWSQASYISSNYIYANASTGIYVQSGTNEIVSNNQVYSNTFAGIYVSGSSNLNSSFNTIYSNAAGINLSGVNTYTLSFNAISGNMLDGVYLYASQSGTVSDNEIFSNNGSGINLNDASNNTVISRNTVDGNKTGGIYAQNSSSITIEANKVRNNTGINGGIYIIGITNAASSIRSNMLSNNENFAIKSQSSAASIETNDIEVSGSGHGIFLQDNVNTVLLQNSLSASPANGFYGLYLKGSTTFNGGISGNNKLQFFEGKAYGGDAAPVQNYINNVYPSDLIQE